MLSQIYFFTKLGFHRSSAWISIKVKHRVKSPARLIYDELCFCILAIKCVTEESRPASKHCAIFPQSHCSPKHRKSGLIWMTFTQTSWSSACLSYGLCRFSPTVLILDLHKWSSGKIRTTSADEVSVKAASATCFGVTLSSCGVTTLVRVQRKCAFDTTQLQQIHRNRQAPVNMFRRASGGLSFLLSARKWQ